MFAKIRELLATDTKDTSTSTEWKKSMSEKKLWDGLKSLEDAQLPRSINLWRVENSAHPSMADVHYQIEKVSTGWIENKWVNKIGNKIKFQEGQERWLANYCFNGGEAFVLAGDNKGMMALYWGADFCTLNLEKVDQKNIEPIATFERNHIGFIALAELIMNWCP